MLTADSTKYLHNGGSRLRLGQCSSVGKGSGPGLSLYSKIASLLSLSTLGIRSFSISEQIFQTFRTFFVTNFAYEVCLNNWVNGSIATYFCIARIDMIWKGNPLRWQQKAGAECKCKIISCILTFGLELLPEKSIHCIPVFQVFLVLDTHNGVFLVLLLLVILFLVLLTEVWQSPFSVPGAWH